MLSSIHIENIAVIKCTDIDFVDGFCAITGETGAGKSIVMDSIRLLVGGKCDRELLRRGESSAQVSGLFTDISDSGVELIRELGYECEGRELLVMRTFTSDGKSTVRLNGRTATASLLKSISGALIDFHGQHDNATLLDRKTHLRLLDEYARISALVSEYKACYSTFTKAKTALSDFEKDSADKSMQLDFLKSRIKEIEAVKPKPDELEKLEAERDELAAAAKIKKQANYAYRALYGGEKGNACMLIDKSISALEGVGSEIEEIKSLIARMRDVYYEIDDISESLAKYTDDGVDPTLRLDKLEGRIDAINRLKKKYSASVPEILRIYAESKSMVEKYENSDAELEELNKAVASAEKDLREKSKRLTAKRKEAAEKMSGEIAENLYFLDMPKVRFEILCEPLLSRDGEPTYSPDGADRVTFTLALSEKETPIELGAASGGELARVMLALKCVLSEKFGAGTVVYDEIDTGVSGKTARKIGLKLKESAKNTQVICVTHSAQIASLAHEHLKIAKDDRDGRFESGVKVLDREGRIDELSRILGSINVTESQRRAAEDMLDRED